MTNQPHDLEALAASEIPTEDDLFELDRKSTRLNSSHT